MPHALLHQRPRYPGLVNDKIAYVSPLQYPNLKFWGDTTKITGLSDSDKVSQWNDLSGNGNHAVQANSSYQPVYKTNVENGLPAILFSGASYVRLVTPAFALSVYTIYMVVKRVSYVVGYPIIYEQDTVNSGMLLMDNSGYFYHRYIDGWGDCLSSPLTTSPYNLTCQATESKLYTRYNGIAIANSSNSAGATSRTKTTSIGNSDGGGNGWNGYVMELIVYGEAQSAKVVSTLETYLSKKWDI